MCPSKDTSSLSSRDDRDSDSDSDKQWRAAADLLDCSKVIGTASASDCESQALDSDWEPSLPVTVVSLALAGHSDWHAGGRGPPGPI